MSIAQPAWFLLLLILPLVLIGAILSQVKRKKVWRQLIAPRLRPHLIREDSQVGHWLSIGLALLGIGLLITALTRPHQGETTITQEIQSRDIIVAVDISRSMLTEDTNPSRLSAAKAIAIDLLSRFPDDRIGLIAFSGTAVLVAPLTIDHAAIHNSISQLDTQMIPSGGSSLASAVDIALKTFGRNHNNSNALIILSDGEDHTTLTQQAAGRIRSSQLTVCSIGIGSQSGGIIPDPRSHDGKFHDIRGNTVLSKMNPEALTELSLAGNGTFVTAELGSTHAVQQALSSLQANRKENRTISVPNERYHWFLIPALIMLTLSMLTRCKFRTAPKPPAASTPVVALILLFLTLTVRAETTAQAAREAYQKGDFVSASELLQEALDKSNKKNIHALHFSLGCTAYKLKDWHNATLHLTEALDSPDTTLQQETHYNLGNTLFQKSWPLIQPAGKPTAPQDTPENQINPLNNAITLLEDAISHYQSTLKIAPDHSAAKYNLDQARRLLEQLKQKKKQHQQKQEGQQGEQPDSPPQQGEGDKPDPKQQSDNGDGEESSESNPSSKKGDKENQSNKKNQGDQEGSDNNQPAKSEPNPNQPSKEQQPNTEPREGETPEQAAARILKQHSDSENRPIQRRSLILRRPSKDW